MNNYLDSDYYSDGTDEHFLPGSFSLNNNSYTVHLPCTYEIINDDSVAMMLFYELNDQFGFLIESSLYGCSLFYCQNYIIAQPETILHSDCGGVGLGTISYDNNISTFENLSDFTIFDQSISIEETANVKYKKHILAKFYFNQIDVAGYLKLIHSNGIITEVENLGIKVTGNPPMGYTVNLTPIDHTPHITGPKTVSVDYYYSVSTGISLAGSTAPLGSETRSGVYSESL